MASGGGESTVAAFAKNAGLSDFRVLGERGYWVIDLPSHDDALLFVINGQFGRRNLSEIDRIALVSKREAIVRRLARERQLASLPNKGERGFQSVRSRFAECVGAIANTLVSTNSRKELATEAGVGETTYAAGKMILDAVESGTAQPEVIEDIRTGKATIHGVAKTLKAKRSSKSKSGWQSVVSRFAAACPRLVRRDATRCAEIAAELRKLVDEFATMAIAVVNRNKLPINFAAC